MTRPVDCFVSVVAPLENCGPFVRDFIREVIDTLKSYCTNYELVLVDDGSTDDTPERVSEMLGVVPCVRYIRLSRHFGVETAIASGLDSVIGDFTVVMLPECDPPALIPDIVERARTGAGVVFGVSTDRSGDVWWRRLGARLFYRIGARTIFHGQLPEDSTQFRALSRQAVNAITRMKDRYRYLRLLSVSVGYATQSFRYDRVWRPGARRPERLAELVGQAVGMVVSYSPQPLRWVTWLGLAASGLNLLYMVYVVGIFLLRSKVAEGWTTLSLQSSGMFFLLFLCLTVIAEYLGHMIVEIQDRPLYNVLEERNSNVLLADARRTNIHRESTMDGRP